MAKNSRHRTKKAPAPNPAPATAGLQERLQGWDTTCTTWLQRHRLWIEPLLVALIVVAGIGARIEDLGAWRAAPTRAFYQQQPLHTTFDAWFYLSLAQDLVDGTYAPIDEKRGIPDEFPRPSPPPLLSCVAAAVHQLTGLSLSWAGALIPVLFGSLLAIPLYLLGRWYGGPLTGAVAALLALLYPIYIHRSNIGRFDTDCLNLAFATAIAYAFLRFGTLRTLRRYGYAAAGFVLYGLFLWWWDQAPAAASAISLLPFGAALVLYYRPALREAACFGAALLVLAAVALAVVGTDVPARLLSSLWHQFLYISKDTSSQFPNIGLTISEQSVPSLAQIVAYTTQHGIFLLAAAAGMALLIWRHRRGSMLLCAFFALSVLAFTTANRFIMFLNILLALGCGYCVTQLWQLRRRWMPLYLLCPLAIVLLVSPLVRAAGEFTQWPKESAPLVEGMDYARQHTPADAVIWAWWDHGYALTYYARRATVNDGSIHSGERTVYTALPYSLADFRQSANFIQFYVTHGISGIKQFTRAAHLNRADGLALILRILAAGPEDARAVLAEVDLSAPQPTRTTEDWLRFFFPPDPRPIYLLADQLLPRIAYWWYWFGTWDCTRRDGIHPAYQPFYNVRRHGDSLVGPGVQVDLRSGNLQFSGGSTTLGSIRLHTRGTQRQHTFYRGGGYQFEWNETTRMGVLMSSDIADSVFNKLYLRHQFDKRYFEPLRARMPAYQLWRVRGERMTAANTAS